MATQKKTTSMEIFKNDFLEISHENNVSLMSRYPDNHFDLAIIDPPYGIGEDGGKSESRCKATKVKPNNYKKKNWDSKPPKPSFFKEIKRVSKHQIIWGANHFIENIPNANSPCWIVWDKMNGENDFADCELAYASFGSAVRRIKLRWHGMLQHDMKNKEIRIHPTQKPVKLYEWILVKYAKKGFKIIDTHLGSGSHAIAIHRVNQLEKLDLHLTACEIDDDYFPETIQRIKNETSQNKLIF